MISNSSNLAIYEQIISQIKSAIINKDIIPGDAMPSIRGLAKDLQISVITTKRAYEELEKEGLIYSVSGKGFYVCEQNTDILKEKKVSMIEKHLQEIINECKAAGLSLEDIKDMIEVLFQENE
ncbi:MAG TPA: GntR family transcriptional regulator [Lachnospiraceae bacterium]|nr:GntR family transcriptional regulator [Lachnospiraceae bacterium]